ncbi:MAG: M48 family metallopeptidase [Deltaproteobacteria bacterium]|nr:M48 family metallopeptidase [Deltaproteobacteria bacterium]
MARLPADLDLLSGYPDALREEALGLREAGRLSAILRDRYPEKHAITDNAALYRYVMDLKRTHLRQSAPLSKVRYSDKIAAVRQAFGTHTYVSRVQGSRLKASNELRIASMFKDLPPEFLQMIAVHELAHLRHQDHDKAFYRLCEHIEPSYFRYELDLRLWLFAEQGAG